MASQLRFEGPDLEALLEHVRHEAGTEAHIVAANRIRKGRVIARDAYEVIVEIPDVAPRVAPAPARVPAPAPEVPPVRPQSAVRKTVLDLAAHMPEVGPADVIDLDPEPRPRRTRNGNVVSPRVLSVGSSRRDVATEDRRRAAVQRLARQEARPGGEDVFVAVVGADNAAVALARRIAEEFGVDPEHIMLATPEQLEERARAAAPARPRVAHHDDPDDEPSDPEVSATRTKNGKLPVIALDPMIEHMLSDTLRSDESGSSYLAIQPKAAEQFALAIAREAAAAETKGIDPVLVCATQLRASLRRLLHTVAPRLPVLAYTELGQQLELETIGVVNLGQPAAV